MTSRNAIWVGLSLSFLICATPQAEQKEKVLFCGQSWPVDTKQISCNPKGKMDYSVLVKLELLESFSLWGTSGDSDAISKLKYLRSLHFSRSTTSLKPYAGLKRLESLGITQSSFSDLAGVESLVNL